MLTSPSRSIPLNFFLFQIRNKYTDKVLTYLDQPWVPPSLPRAAEYAFQNRIKRWIRIPEEIFAGGSEGYEPYSFDNASTGRHCFHGGTRPGGTARI